MNISGSFLSKTQTKDIQSCTGSSQGFFPEIHLSLLPLACSLGLYKPLLFVQLLGNCKHINYFCRFPTTSVEMFCLDKMCRHCVILSLHMTHSTRKYSKIQKNTWINSFTKGEDFSGKTRVSWRPSECRSHCIRELYFFSLYFDPLWIMF